MGSPLVVHRHCGGYVASNGYGSAERWACAKCRNRWIPAAVPDSLLGHLFLLCSPVLANVLVIASEGGKKFIKVVSEAEAESPEFERWQGAGLK